MNYSANGFNYTRFRDVDRVLIHVVHSKYKFYGAHVRFRVYYNVNAVHFLLVWLTRASAIVVHFRESFASNKHLTLIKYYFCFK